MKEVITPVPYFSPLASPLRRAPSRQRRTEGCQHFAEQSQYSSQSYDAALSIELDNGGKEYFLLCKNFVERLTTETRSHGVF